MHELPFIILARRGDDDGNQEQQQEQEPGQDVLPWGRQSESHVQGPCCGLDSESTNVHTYIDRAGGGSGTGGCGRRRGRTLPQTTRVRKAINKQDTSRMSNINNKNESRWRTLHPFCQLSSPASPLPPPASCHSEHSHEWCLNGNVWMAARAEQSSAERGKDVCLFMLCLLAPLETPKTSDRFAPTKLPPSTRPPLNLAQIENIYVLCKANCVVSRISKE